MANEKGDPAEPVQSPLPKDLGSQYDESHRSVDSGFVRQFHADLKEFQARSLLRELMTAREMAEMLRWSGDNSVSDGSRWPGWAAVMERDLRIRRLRAVHPECSDAIGGLSVDGKAALDAWCAVNPGLTPAVWFEQRDGV